MSEQEFTIETDERGRPKLDPKNPKHIRLFANAIMPLLSQIEAPNGSNDSVSIIFLNDVLGNAANALEESESLRSHLAVREEQIRVAKNYILGCADCFCAGDFVCGKCQFLAKLTALDAGVETKDAQPAPAKAEEVCKWSPDDDEWFPYWHSACGCSLEFTDGPPHKIKMKFCPFCGRPVRVAAVEGHDQDQHSEKEVPPSNPAP